MQRDATQCDAAQRKPMHGTANQRIATVLAIPLILVLLLIPNTWTRRNKKQNTFMIVSVPATNTARTTLDVLMDQMEEHASTVDLRRMEVRGDSLEATLYVAANSATGIADIIDTVRSTISDAEIAFIEQEPGLG